MAQPTWWLSGGISSANCVAAYQPVGAGSLALSYKNLTGNATYDAAPGVAPTWDVVNGWKFASTQYLDTGIIPASGWSMSMQYSNIPVDSELHYCGQLTNNARFALGAEGAGNRLSYQSGGYVANIPILLTGNMTVAGNQGYRNGVADGTTISGWTASATHTIYIGKLNNYSPADFLGNIKAYAIYNTTLTAAQVLAVTNAMNALPFPFITLNNVGNQSIVRSNVW